MKIFFLIFLKLIILIYFLFAFNFSLIKADWVQVSNGITQLNINALTSYSSNGVNYIFAGTLGTYSGSGIFLTTNNGDNWALVFNIPNDVWALANTNNGGNTYVYGGTSSGMCCSTNNGTNWYSVIFPNGGHWLNSIATNSNNIFAGAMWWSNDSGGVYKSTNYGTNWIRTLYGPEVNALAINGNYIFAGAGGGANLIVGVFKSTDSGSTWIQTPFPNTTVWALAINGNYIFAGTGNGIYLSSNNGSNWILTSLPNYVVQALLVYNNNIFAGGGDGSGHCFWISTNNGSTWVSRNENMNYYVNALCISNGYIFAGTDGNGVFRRPLNELIGIEKISLEIPTNYKLYQNYPNPFNPTTKIKFSIPNIPLSRGVSEGRGVLVVLKIYDILGREITTIVNEKLQPGTYEVEWNASNYTSGIYFYKLIANEGISKYMETKKLILIK